MKKRITAVLTLLLIVSICLSLCSCNVFRTMRENAQKASMIPIAETPDDEEAVALLQAIVSDSAEIADEMKETVSYDAGNPEIYSGDQEAGLLDAAAKQLRSMIMESKPGRTETSLSADDLRLLNKLDAKDALDISVDRNYGTEKVTDEKGNYMADENGEVITERYISDNILHLTVSYFNTNVIDSKTKEDGSVEEITECLPSDSATIENVFGEPADKEAVLSAFDAVSDYIKVNDYSIVYTNCRIVADLNLDENIVSFVRFEKHMDVTAQAVCLGKMADYGEITVSFPLTKNIEYSFSYPAAE